MTEQEVIYKVGLPNGVTWIYHNKRQAENASLIARALAAMPSKKQKHRNWGTICNYGQQSALAKALGYFQIEGNPRSPANHSAIYNLLTNGGLPRSPERLQKLRDIAATMPDDWFEHVVKHD